MKDVRFPGTLQFQKQFGKGNRSGPAARFSSMTPRAILATLGIICAVASLFVGGVPLLTGGVVFIGIATLL